MKVSYNWLKDYIKTDLAVDEIATILTDIGLEVEGIETIESIKGGLKGLVVGEVISCEQHTNADKLKTTIVDIGGENVLPIVCGAPNVAKGQKVAVATVGTILYAEEGEFKIKKSKIRGEVSEGMLCAEDEIGLGKSHEGILVLDESAKIGTPLAEYFKLTSDTVFEIGLTPNRIDAASHYGVARDLAAYLNLTQKVELLSPSVENFAVDNRNLAISVEVKDIHRCPRYSGVSISNVKVQSSPTWLQNKLKAIGVKPINNVVDITNFVLHELGQPLHAFDADEIADHKVVVQTASKGETFITLDGVERKLMIDDLMIRNTQSSMCIAGVFGGEKSGVGLATQHIFLESAYFNPVSIRKTAKRQGLNTDASFRYERGTDPEITVYALKRAALLIKELAGGEISSELIDLYPKPIPHQTINLSIEKINKLIGNNIAEETVRAILANLEIKIESEKEGVLNLIVPSYRVDIQRDVDLIEEILRIYGYNNITLPTFMKSSLAINPQIQPHRIENVVANLLSSIGFSEVFNNSLTNPSYYNDTEQLVAMVNPLSKETEVLRGSMLYGGLEAIAHNQKRKRKNIKFYEFGKTYKVLENAQYEETKRLAIWLSGDKEQESWEQNKEAVNYYLLKEKVETILKRVGIVKYKAVKVEDARFDYSIQLTKGKHSLVVFGELNKSELKKVGGKEDVFYAEFNWNAVLQLIGSNDTQYKAVSKFPTMRRDLALLLDEKIAFKDIQSIAKKVEQHLLKEVNLFDVYEGKKLATGKKSYGVSFTFQDEKKTLTDKGIDKIMDKMIAALVEEVGAELR